MECHPGSAGYIQAAGVILTVAGALFGPPIKASYQRWRVRRNRRRNADILAVRQGPDIELLLSRIDWRLEQLGAGSEAGNHPVSIERFGVEIPGILDPTLLRRTPEVDFSRIVHITEFIEAVWAYNNALFNRPVTPGEDDPDAFRQYLLACLLELKRQGGDVLAKVHSRG